jgi:hypothetical protein
MDLEVLHDSIYGYREGTLTSRSHQDKEGTFGYTEGTGRGHSGTTNGQKRVDKGQ